MKIRFVLQQIGKRVLPVLILAFFTAASFLFAQGRFTFSFLANRTPSPGPTAPTSDGSADPDNPIVHPGEDTGIPDIPAETHPQFAASEEQLLTMAAKIPFAPFSVPVLREEGFVLSAEPFAASTSVLAFAGSFDFFPHVQSFYSEDTTRVEYVRPDAMSEPEAVYVPAIRDVPAIELYMGLLLMDDSENTAVYTSDGLYLFTFKTGDYVPAYTRDKQGNPLFKTVTTETVTVLAEKPADPPDAPEETDGEPEESTDSTDFETVEQEMEVTHYYTVSDNGFVPSDYNDFTDGRGLYFDYPPYFGISDSALIRSVRLQTTVTEHLDGSVTVEDTSRFAYGYSPRWLRTGFLFPTAWDFSENLAAVTDENGHQYFINPSGYAAFYTQKNYYWYEWYVIEYLLPPLSSGPESIGFYYYDHGLVRARRQVIDSYAFHYLHKKRAYIDQDFLMDTSGAEFPIPEGYRIVSYSDGVILLESGGKYGYMDYTGAWIAQPIYDYAEPFSEGLAVAGFASGVRLMIDTEGEIVIPPGQFTYISNVSSGVIAAWDGSSWSLFHKMAKIS